MMRRSRRRLKALDATTADSFDAVTSGDAEFDRTFDAWHQLDLTAFERWQAEDARWSRDTKVRVRR